MTDDITIPEEARRAGGAVVRDSEASTWEEVAEQAFLAMIRAWPGMGPIRTDQPIGDWCDKLPAIILPLLQEASNE